MTANTAPDSPAQENRVRAAERLMRIAEQAEGSVGYGVTAAFLEQYEQDIAAAQRQAVERHDQSMKSKLLGALPEKKPKVVRRKGYYPPYQPQVEQHKRDGFNEALDEARTAIEAVYKKENIA